MRKKIKDLKRIIKNCKILPDKVGSKKAILGSFVTLKSDDNRITKYRLVHPVESSPYQNLLSVESPLGKSLLGKKRGDTILFRQRKYKVIGIN